MKLRLLTTLLAAALSGCATYDYTSGSAPGGYYHGRPSVEYYGPYGDSYGYGYPAYGGYGYYGSRGYYNPRYYYGGYYPYYPPYRPHRPRPPRDDHNPPVQGDRAPPWRRPDGRYQESGGVMIPPRNRGVPQAPSQPGQPSQPIVRNPGRNPGVSQILRAPRPMAQPSAPRAVERPRMTERAAPPARQERSETSGRVRTLEP